MITKSDGQVPKQRPMNEIISRKKKIKIDVPKTDSKKSIPVHNEKAVHGKYQRFLNKT